MKQILKYFGLHYAYNFDENDLIVAIGDARDKAWDKPKFVWFYQYRLWKLDNE